MNKGDKGTSKVKRLNRSMGEFGEQEVWESNNGKLYKSVIDLEDGASGQVWSKKEDPPYKEGDTVNYTVTRVHEKYGPTLSCKIPDENRPGGGGGRGKSRELDPNAKKQIMMNVAIFSAVTTVDRLRQPIDLESCIDEYRDWLITKIHGSGYNEINAQSALKMAAALAGAEKQNVDSPQQVVMLANRFYDKIMMGCPDSLIQQASSKSSNESTNRVGPPA